MADADLKLTFHIGMGKTGTSAIQASLKRSPERLREHGLCYLGMWWGFLDPDLEGPAGIEAGAGLDEARARALAERLLETMRSTAARDGVKHFIFSNEALYAHTDAYEALYAHLADYVDLKFVVFVREPREWLASAYAQWGIRHRPEPGPAPGFAKWAEEHIGIYGGLRYWHRRFGSRLVVRTFDGARDVVPEFCDAIGTELALESRREYETLEPALLLLQAEYDLLAVGDPTPVNVEAAIERHFDQSSVPALLSRWREVFDAIEDELGIDLLASADQGLPSPDPDAVRSRMLDHLVAIALRQARQIASLEARLEERETKPAGPS